MSREYRISCIVPDTPAGAQLIKACKDLVEQANEELRRSNATVSFRINGIYGDPPACEPKSIEDGCDIGIAYGDSLSSWVNENISRKSFLLMSAAEIEGMNDIHLKAYPSATTMGRHLAELTRRCIKKYKTKNPCALFENSMAGSLCCESFLSSASDFAVRQKNVFTYEKDDEYFGDYVASLINTGFRVFCVYGFETSGKGYKSLLNSLVEWREKDKTIKILTDVNLPDKILIPDKIFNGAECVDALVCGSSGNSNRYCVGVKFFEMLMEALVELIVKSAMWSFDDGNTDICLKNEIRENFNYISTKIGTFSFVNNALCVPFYYHFLKTPLVNPEFFRSDGDSRDSIYIATARVESLTNKISQDGLSEFDETCIDAKDRFIKEILKKCFSVVKAWFIDDDFDFIDDKLKFKKSLALIKGNSIIQVPYNTKYDLSSTNVLQFYWRNDSGEREVLSVDGVEQLKKLNKFQIGVTRDNLNSADGDCRIFSVEESARFVEEFSELKLKLNEVQNGRYLYYIPYVRTSATRAVNNVSGIILVASVKYRDVELAALKNLEERFFGAIFAVDNQLRINRESVKSAIGSIMSRNGSHNIGSHVLATLSHNIGTMPDDRVLYQYIQHRMDYIATAVGELPSWTYSTKFVGGVIREFLSQRHLLEYISKSEGLQAFKFQDPNHIGNNRFNQKNTIRLHVRRSDYGLPKGVNEVDFIEYSETNDDVQQRLQYDIDVALPGGVVGGHAFFTILENVIRNAAKHGWATKSETERKDENLDIYVDFKRDEDCQNATVVVYDGISDVLSVLDEEKSNDVGERNGIRKLKDWIEANRETLCSSLDKKSLEQLKAYIEDKGENLPIPYGGLVNVLSESVDCGGDNNGKKKKVWEVIKGNLAGKTDSDKELGHRLWLPLHHSHQIKLATPFIDDAGSLRRENWGLAEMKISAGYLQMRTISEIGGLDSDVNGYDGFKKIITPVCVKHVSFSKDGKKETHHHLGYEFKIRCPRELLFVVQGEKPSGDAAKAAEQILLRHGVHIRYIEDSGYDAVFALQNNPSRLEWDFRYVMLPVFPQVPNPKLPFRVLAGKRSCKWCVPHFQEYSTFRKRLESVLAGAEDAEIWVHDLKKAVYKAWLAYWQSDRRKDIGKPVLSLVVDPGGGSGDGAGKRGGECLISDSDLWSVVLGNLFRTLVRQHLSLSFGHELEYRMKCYLVRIAVSDTREMLSDFDVSRPRYSLGRQMAAWFEKSNLGNIPKDETLKSLAKDFMAADDAVPRQERDKILGKIVDGDYAAEIQQFHSSLKEWLVKCKNAKSSSEHDFEAPQVDVNGKFYNYPGFQKFMDSCLVAFEHSAVFLRKYEERIATLPESFQVKAHGGDGSSFVNATAQIGIDAVTGGRIPESRKAIRYERHFDVGAFDRDTMAYAEPLSGTQTYLNMLGQLVGNNDCPIETVYSVSVSLMENALTRILIIDERTADFLKKHELSKQTYAHMGVWVLDDKTVEGCTPSQKSPDNKEWNPNVEQALLSASDIGVRIFTDMANCDGEERRRWSKFDIVVIHQGLIDKWLSASAHDAKGVESLLERLKERVPYVVITTGRGTPSNTPVSARILPFSVIEKTMFRQSPEKMILVDTVMNILPVGERKQ